MMPASLCLGFLIIGAIAALSYTGSAPEPRNKDNKTVTIVIKRGK